MASRKPSILPLPEEGTRSIQPGQRQSLSSQVRTILLELSKSVPPTSQPEATHKILLPPCMIEPADDDWSDDLNGLGHIVPANDTIRVTPARSAFASMQPPIQTHRTTIPGFSAAYTTTKESNSSGRSTLPEGVKLHTTRSVPVAAGTILPSQGGSLDLLKTNPGLGESGDITTQEMCRKKLEKELAQIRATILREQNIAAQNELKRITSRTDPDKLSLFRVATDSHKNDSQHEINLDKASGEINNQSLSLSTKPTSVSTSPQTLFNLKALRACSQLKGNE